MLLKTSATTLESKNTENYEMFLTSMEGALVN